MSMPEFPEINPDLTRDQALNMILASIAMEEAALSHIINAEGEKLQYVLGTLKTGCGKAPTIDEVLAANQSVTCLLDSVSQNQMILKSKMEKALGALSKPCPCPGPCPGPCPKPCPGPVGPPGPPGPPGPQGPEGASCKCCCKCSAVFNAANKCQLWRPGSALSWNAAHVSGGCVCFDPCDNTKINLLSMERFIISFAVNAKSKSNGKSDAAISLQMINTHQRADIYTVYNTITDDAISTISISGIIVEAGCRAFSSLLLKLVSPDPLVVEDSMLSIMEI